VADCDSSIRTGDCFVMHLPPRATELVTALALSPHPEGGYFREIHRSARAVQPDDGRPARAALTTIYFLLTDSDVSRWHRVASDEVWSFLEGAPLELHTADATFDRMSAGLLGPYADDVLPVRVVDAGCWQAARSTGPYTLVTCTVGPGFDFADFAMLRDQADDAAALRRKYPQAAALV